MHSELANPFAVGDEMHEKFSALERIVYDQQDKIDMLMRVIGLLARAENIRLDRKMNAEKK